jgi:methionine synthase II (cobalamin-independent)
MKKMLLVLALCLCGCAAEKEVSFDGVLLPVNKDWKEKYGESEQSQIYYNLAVIRYVVDKNSVVLDSVSSRVKKLEDPNEIAKKIHDGVKILYDNAEQVAK